jgi:hypothetical protein
VTGRQPARESYDAIVELFPPRGVAKRAYALVRRTYHVAEGGRMSRAAPVPLAPRVEGAGPLCSRWGDLSFARQRTDVAVRGAAYAAGARLATRRQIALSVGARTKRVEVFGRRVIEWSRGRPRFSDPEPFAFVPATLENAYGGLDPRVTHGEDDARGRYPRNPTGKGYLIGSAPADGIELPNLEDPENLLTPASILVADPREWWRQPLPFCFEPSSALAFPRSAFSGAELVFPPPEHEELEEVRRGFLPRGWRALAGELAYDVPPVAFAQRGALGQTFDPLAPETRIAVSGMHPTRERFEVVVPAPPRLAIEIDGKPVEVAPRLVSVLVEPREERVSFTWAGVLETLPRLLMPTLHASIPLAMRADGDALIEYLAPPTLRELIEARIAEIRAVRPKRVPERDTLAPPPPSPEPEPERATDPGPIDPPGAPPRVGRIADVEAFVAPYQAPAGASFKPAPQAAWRSDGEHTGRLVLPGEERPAIVPKTLQIALPEARAYGIPATRQVILPEARTSELRAERTVILSELASKVAPLAEERTKILAPKPASIAAPSVSQRRPPARERTQILTEGQLRGDEPVPGRRRPASMYEESTSVLSSTELDADELTDTSHLDDGDFDDVPLGAPRSEAVFLDEPDELAGGGTQVLYDAELTELDEDE